MAKQDEIVQEPVDNTSPENLNEQGLGERILDLNSFLGDLEHSIGKVESDMYDVQNKGYAQPGVFDESRLTDKDKDLLKEFEKTLDEMHDEWAAKNTEQKACRAQYKKMTGNNFLGFGEPIEEKKEDEPPEDDIEEGFGKSKRIKNVKI